jgi:hypothetical protein
MHLVSNNLSSRLSRDKTHSGLRTDLKSFRLNQGEGMTHDATRIYAAAVPPGHISRIHFRPVTEVSAVSTRLNASCAAARCLRMGFELA